MIALSIVLGFIKIADMPYGGSVTVASMIPIVIAAYRHGLKWGMGAAIANSAVQLFTGIKYFSYFTTWQSIVALILFDYLIAFAVFGLAGILRGRMKQNLALALGALGASVLRYICHVISGATIWMGISIPDGAAIAYSLGYNATYMIPETVILVSVAVYLGSVLDFTRDVPVRMHRETLDSRTMVYLSGAGLLTLGAIVTDCALVFPKLQNPESGAFYLGGLGEVSWLAFGIVSGACLGAAAALALVALKRIKAKA